MNLASQKNIISRSVSGFSHANNIFRKSAAYIRQLASV